MKKLLLLSLTFNLMGFILQAKTTQEAAVLVTATAKALKGDAGAELVTTVSDFSQKLAAGKPTVAKFFAPWCSYCVRMAPVFKAIASKYADTYTFCEINTDNARELAAKYSVRGIPVFKFFDKNGTKVGEFTGYVDQVEFEKRMNAFLANV